MCKECFKDGSKVFQGCCFKSVVKRVFLKCFSDVLIILQGFSEKCFKDFSGMFQGCFKDI